MSQGTRRPLQEALREAEQFRALFDGTYQRWEIAGSVRRCRPDVADIEHVVIPRMEKAADGLFGQAKTVNLVWMRLDALLAARDAKQALYVTNTATGAMSPRWGQLFRGVQFRSMRHEMSMATPANWGAILLIKTGPANFSQHVVTRLKQGGRYRQQDGELVCVQDGKPIAVPNEAFYLALAGLKFIEPKRRG